MSADDWKDLLCPPGSLDCLDGSVVRRVLSADVEGARTICRRHLLSDDSDKTDAWIVEYLSYALTRGLGRGSMHRDYHELAVGVILRLLSKESSSTYHVTVHGPGIEDPCARHHLDEMDDDAIERARTFAVEAHGGQTYGSVPYAHHLDEVASVLVAHELAIGDAGGATQLAVAYLHDVLEDCQGAIERMRPTATAASVLHAEFGRTVAEAVAFCTDEPGKNRRERKAATYARVRTQVANWWHLGHDREHPVAIGLRCKLADRVANLRAGIRSRDIGRLSMYVGEAREFTVAYDFRIDRESRSMFDEHFLLIEYAERRLRSQADR